MTFDEIWRMNLVKEKDRKDLTNEGTEMEVEQNRNDLELTEEDRAFLLQVGIRS
jgi:hypothetical protein